MVRTLWSGVGSGVIFPDLLIAQKSPELSKIDRIDFSMLYFLYFLVPIFDYTVCRLVDGWECAEAVEAALCRFADCRWMAMI